MKKHVSITIALLMLAASLGAQPQGERPAHPKMKDPSQMAKEVTDRMQAEVCLDKKQYKKVYNLFKKDFEYRQQAMEEKFNGGMPPQGGGPGMGGGMPPQGGMPGGMPPQGGRPEGGPGMGGPGMGGPGMGGPGGPGGDVITDEYLEKQDKKLQKILTPEQYKKWRSKNPAEHMDLPPVEFK